MNTGSGAPVSIVEVAPRDGLQNEHHIVPTDVKIAWINALSRTGLRRIEVTSFVRSDRVPQLADAEIVLAEIDRIPNVAYGVLVPNLQGLERALVHRPDAIALFIAVSETFNQRNIGASIEESFARFTPVIADARQAGLPIRGYLSTVIGCPYEGVIDPGKVAEMAERFMMLGVDEVSLGDTIGVGTPAQVKRLLDQVSQRVPVTRIAVHFHDTYGQALANVQTALDQGVCIIDSSVHGLGGCPFAPGASGNVATEEVVYLLEGQGCRTGVDLPALLRAGGLVGRILGRPPVSRLARVPLESIWLNPGKIWNHRR
ncbi:MAG: hydroxymethylglutaryl-CoA lyase [Gammaproteobacteria bacterium]